MPEWRSVARWTQRAVRSTLFLALACAGEPEAPHGIVLIGLDTLRADALSAYGNPRATSPTIDRLAAEGVLFERVSSNASWTLPGFIGIFTGSYVSRRVFPGKLEHSLVERLRDAGYATAAFTEGGYVSSQFGFDRGFDVYWEEEGAIVLADPASRTPGTQRGGVERTFAAARRWLNQNGKRPFFLFVHTYEVHLPYLRRRFARDLPSGRLGPVYGTDDQARVAKGEVPAGAVETAYVQALYEGGVALADGHVAALLEALANLAVLDRTIIAITSDHGEELGERKPSLLGVHGHGLYESVLRVPLVIRDPRRTYPVSRVGALVRTIDVMPTLLDLAGIELPETEGRSLVPLMRGENRGDRIAYSEHRDRDAGTLKHAALRTGNHKLVFNAGQVQDDQPRLELYDLAADPHELRNLADRRPQLRRELFALLKQQSQSVAGQGRAPLGSAQELPAALRKRLESLGYLDTTR